MASSGRLITGGALVPPITLTNTAPATVPFSIVGAASQSAHLLDVTANGGSAGGLFNVDSTGQITQGGNVLTISGATNPRLLIGSTNFFGSATAGAAFFSDAASGDLVMRCGGTNAVRIGQNNSGTSSLVITSPANVANYLTIAASAGASGVVIDTSSSFVQIGPTTATAVGLGRAAGALSFYGHASTAQPTVTGSKGANAALASLMTALSGFGLVIDSTT